MVLDGRFQQSECSGEVMGSQFTGIFYFEGTAGPDGKVVTQKSRYDDLIKGPIKVRALTKIVDENRGA